MKFIDHSPRIQPPDIEVAQLYKVTFYSALLGKTLDTIVSWNISRLPEKPNEWTMLEFLRKGENKKFQPSSPILFEEYGLPYEKSESATVNWLTKAE